MKLGNITNYFLIIQRMILAKKKTGIKDNMRDR